MENKTRVFDAQAELDELKALCNQRHLWMLDRFSEALDHHTKVLSLIDAHDKRIRKLERYCRTPDYGWPVPDEDRIALPEEFDRKPGAVNYVDKDGAFLDGLKKPVGLERDAVPLRMKTYDNGMGPFDNPFKPEVGDILLDAQRRAWSFADGAVWTLNGVSAAHNWQWSLARTQDVLGRVVETHLGPAPLTPTGVNKRTELLNWLAAGHSFPAACKQTGLNLIEGQELLGKATV